MCVCVCVSVYVRNLNWVQFYLESMIAGIFIIKKMCVCVCVSVHEQAQYTVCKFWEKNEINNDR